MNEDSTRNGFDALPATLRAAIEDELVEDERLLWAGQPDPKRLAVSSIPVLIFGVPWTAFSLFWTASAFAMTRDHGTPALFRWLFPLWGVPFVLVGVGMLGAPFFAGSRARATVYVITDRRVLVITEAGRGRRGVEAFVPQVGAGLKRRVTGGGRGDLTLPRPFGGSMRLTGGAGRGLQTSTQADAVTFHGVPDVAAVERLMLATFEAAAAPAYGGSAAGGVGALPAHLGGAAPTPATTRRPYEVDAPALARVGADAGTKCPPLPYVAGG